MNRPKFRKICQSVAAGEDKYLENTRNHHAGKVVSCSGEHVEIEISGKMEIWSRRECKEFYFPETDYRP